LLDGHCPVCAHAPCNKHIRTDDFQSLFLLLLLSLLLSLLLLLLLLLLLSLLLTCLRGMRLCLCSSRQHPHQPPQTPGCWGLAGLQSQPGKNNSSSSSSSSRNRSRIRSVFGLQQAVFLSSVCASH
jgi:hypothetical protein